MLREGKRFCSFGPFRADLQTQELYKNYDRIRIRPKAFAALVYLIENTGQVVRKTDLIEHVWGRDTTSDDTDLTALIRDIRKALGDNVEDPTYLETVPGRGYRFRIADVTYTDEELPALRWKHALVATAIAAAPLIGLLWFLAVPSCAIVIPIPLLVMLGIVAVLGSAFIALAGHSQAATPVSVRWIAAILSAVCALCPLSFATLPEKTWRMRPGGPWINNSLPPQKAQFLVAFETVPSRDRLDSVFALSAGQGSEWRSFACLARLSVAGRIEAFDGERDSYRSLARVDYHRRQRYRFYFAVDVPNHRYSVYVRDGAGREYTIARLFTFRNTQSTIHVIDNFGTKMDFTTADNPLSSACVCGLRLYPF